MVFANVRKVVRIVLPFDHFHRLQLMRSVCMFCFNRGIQSVSVCGDTRSSDRISRRKTPMLVTSGRTEPGAESGHWAIWPIPGRLYSRSNSLSWGDNCPKWVFIAIRNEPQIEGLCWAQLEAPALNRVRTKHDLPIFRAPSRSAVSENR